MRIKRSGILVLFIIAFMISGLGCSVKNETELKEYDFKNLLGLNKNELINILGKNYEITTQGVNNQNLGLNYKNIGVLIGLDEEKEIVVEIEFIEGEYLGISTSIDRKSVV